MSLCRAVRLDLCRELEPEAAIRCTTVGQLCDRVKAAQLVGDDGHRGDGRAASEATDLHAIFFAPSQWRGRCAWLYHAEAMLDPDVFMTAARRLIARHEALHHVML